MQVKLLRHRAAPALDDDRFGIFRSQEVEADLAAAQQLGALAQGLIGAGLAAVAHDQLFMHIDKKQRIGVIRLIVHVFRIHVGPSLT